MSSHRVDETESHSALRNLDYSSQQEEQYRDAPARVTIKRQHDRAAFGLDMTGWGSA